MNKRTYIEDCVAKTGKATPLQLTGSQTAAIQGLLAGSVETGRVLALLKKDLFKYGNIKLQGIETLSEGVTPVKVDNDTYMALRGILGMNGELADITETVYSYIQGNKELDIGKLEEDLGDLMFYMSLILSILGVDFEYIQSQNRVKTSKIYSMNMASVLP